MTPESRVEPIARHGTYRLDPARSVLGFRARAARLFWVRGRFTSADGTLTIGPAGLRCRGAADAASVGTGVRLRDWHLRNRDYLSVKAHPTIALAVDDAPFADGTLRARLTVRGQKVVVPLDVEIVQAQPDEIRLRARGTFDRTPLRMSPPVLGVGRKIALELDVVVVAVAD